MTEWFDAVRGRLFEQRTILLRGSLDEGVANQAAAELMTLDATGDSRITVYLDLAGGTLDAAFALVDVVDLVGVPVHAMCVGRADGPAAAVLAVASRRAGTPHSRFRLADPSSAMEGSALELSRWADHHLAQLGRFHQRLALAVGRPVEEVAADCGAGIYLNADEALSYGLIDEIALPQGTVYPLSPRSVGFGSHGPR
jgi:ATP-dependent Clp protease protease subunit